MLKKDFLYFHKLRGALVKKVKEQHPEIEDDISNWKGKEIQFFQNDLEKTVRGRISEKWFYTHLKSNTKKLPRIDILDLLSKYAGYNDWLDFKNENEIRNNFSKKTLELTLVVTFLFVAGFIFLVFFRNYEYNITVIDAYTNQKIGSDKLVITQFFLDESPQQIKENEIGLYSIKSTASKIKFSIEAPYYYSDTIVRKLQHFNADEVIRLMPNDYALMLHYFSNSDTDDWMLRRIQLFDIIADDARIFQVDENGNMALEMYTKHSFINKLTIPSKGLRNIEILDIRFEDEQISHLRFIQKKGGNDE